MTHSKAAQRASMEMALAAFRQKFPTFETTQSLDHLALPLKMVDKSTSPLQTYFGPVFGDETVQTSLLFTE